MCQARGLMRCCTQAVHAVADALERHQVSCCVVDPVLVATSGHSLAGTDVAAALLDR